MKNPGKQERSPGKRGPSAEKESVLSDGGKGKNKMRIKKSWLAGMALLGCVAAGLALWKVKNPGAVVPEYVFNYAENQAEDYPTTRGAYRFAELVEERTGGRIQILVQAEAELGNEKDVLKQMQYGGIDFTRVSLSQMSELIPEMNVLQLPYLYEDSRHMWKVLDGEIGDRFLSMARENELIGLSWYDAGVRNFYTSKKVTSLEDLKGMRIRVQESGIMADLVEALGAVAVQSPYGDVYSALEQRFVDGAENNWPSYVFMNHHEVAVYYMVDEHARIPEMQLMSKHTWDKLSVQDREIIVSCAEESALFERRIWALQEKSSRREALENGVEEVLLPEEEKEKFKEAVETVYEKYGGDYQTLIEEIRQYAASENQ